jgi:hypothetical protein
MSYDDTKAASAKTYSYPVKVLSYLVQSPRLATGKTLCRRGKLLSLETKCRLGYTPFHGE